MLNWFLDDKKQEQPFKFIPKIIINSKSLYIQVEPKDPTNATCININAYSSPQVPKCMIPIRIEWSRFKIKSDSIYASETIRINGNSYFCEPGDVGGYIKAVVKSVDEPISKAEVIIGPIGIDVMMKGMIENALYAKKLTSQVKVCEREHSKDVDVTLFERNILFASPFSPEKLKMEYSISEPKIELKPNDPTCVYLRFEQDQDNNVRNWLNKIFNINNSVMDESSLSIRVPYSTHSNSSKNRVFQKSRTSCPNKLEMRFMTQLSRDLFLFTQRAFVCREDMKNSIYIQRIETLQNLATEHDYYKFLQYMSLKMEIYRIAEIAAKFEQERNAKVKDFEELEQSIGEMTMTYLKIIEEKGKHEKIDFERSYSQINHTRQEILNRKQFRQMKAQNENLKQRIRELNEEIDFHKFFKKEDNESMIFNQTSNPFAKKANESMTIQLNSNSPEGNKSNLKNLHELSMNYANLLEENRILKSENRNFKNQMMNKKTNNKILDRSQNMIEILSSLDEREQREARQARFVEYQQMMTRMRSENEELKRKLNEITISQSKQKGLGVTKQSRFLIQEEPSFINNQSVMNQSVNQSINSNASNSFMNSSITSEAAMLKLQQNLQNLSKINLKLQQDNIRLRKERDYYRNQFSKMKQYIKQFQNGGHHLEDSRLHQTQVSKYREENERLENEKKSLIKRLQSFSKENSQGLKQEYLLREKKIKQLEQSLEKLALENKKLANQKDSSKDMMRTENLELISGENSKLKKINSQLLEEIKCLKVELEQRRDEMMYNSRVIELQNELNFARTNSNSEKSPESSRMLEQINDLSKQIARLKQQNEEKTIKLQTQAHTIEKLMIQHNNIHNSPDKHPSSLSSTNSKQKCYSERCNQSTIEQLQKYKREVKKLQEQIIFMKKSADAINRSRDLTMEMDGYYEEKIDIMKKQMDALYIQNENLSKMCERYGKDAREANKELNKCREKIMNLMRSKHEDSSLLIND